MSDFEPVGITIDNLFPPRVEARLIEDFIGADIVSSGRLSETNLDAKYNAPLAYVAPPTGVYATDTANILVAVNKVVAEITSDNPGGIVKLRHGTYNASIPDIAAIKYIGDSRTGTEICATTGHLLETAQMREGISFEDITLSTRSDHLFEFGSDSGGIANGHFRNVTLITYLPNKSIFKGEGGITFQSYSFEDTHIHRRPTATVPAIDLKSGAGAINCNTFDNVTFYGNDSDDAPAVRMEGTEGAFIHDNTFRNIIGQNNRGGLIHLYSVNGVTFETIAEWDANGDYVDHIVQVWTSASVGGAVSRNVKASNVGTRYGNMAAGKYHFIALTSDVQITDRIGDPNGDVEMSPISNRLRATSSGYSAGVVEYNASKTLTFAIDGIAIFDGTDLTCTLPLPTIGEAGRIFTVKNVNATDLTIAQAGSAGLDGGGSIVLEQWESGRFMTDGGTWLSV